ncbi:MAG: TonB family protein [Deltaproteobacteria bacterium]
MSVGFHGLLILAVIVLASALRPWQKPMELGVSNVKLVEAKNVFPLIEKIDHARSEDTRMPRPREIARTTPKINDAKITRKTVKPRSIAAPKQKIIPLKKRKRTPRRVQAPSPEKPATKPPKKEPPANFLEKRLAAIREKVQNRKKEQSSSRGAQATPHARDGRQGSVGPGNAQVDQELVRWLNVVRGRINSHWSLLGEQRQQQRVAVVGVQMADDGRLMDASLDKSSGDQVFDRSALRAVFQAAPFPPLPPALRERIRSAGGLALRFTPTGIQ